MTARSARPIASIGWILAAAATVAAMAVSFGSDVRVSSGFIEYGDAAVAGLSALQLSFASMGVLLAVRRPRDPVGWLLLLVGIGFAASTAGVMVAAATTGGGAALAAWVASAAWPASGAAMITIGFLFPTGRPQSARWARALAILLAAWAVLYALALVQPGPLLLSVSLENPFGFGPDVAVAYGARVVPLVLSWNGVMTVVSAAAMLTRYREGDALQRTQMRWPMLAVALTMACVAVVLVALIAHVGDGPSTGESLAVGVIATAAASVPVAIGIAILRYRLYDIDRLVSRTIAYGLVSAVLAAAYGASFLLLLAPLSSITGGEGFAVAASTLVVATLFQPLRRRIRAAVDRRFNRARYDAQRTTAAFAERVRDEVDLATLAGELDRAVRTAMEPSRLGLWLRERRP